MNKKGFTLVEIMIVVAIIALLAAIAIPSLLSASRTANAAAAKANILSLSTAAETYSTAHNGIYPATVPELAKLITAATSLCVSSAAAGIQGYYYVCTWPNNGYSFVAVPVTPGTTGDTVFAVTTGGVITEAAAVAAKP